MNIGKFSIAEMYSNSKGKTSASLFAAHVLIITGCFMGIKGSFTLHSESMLQGIAFAGMGTGLLAVRRYTPDKPVSDDANKSEGQP
jgi:hypothetical protein